MKPQYLSELSDEDLAKVIMSRLRMDAMNLRDWRRFAFDCFKMKDGDQWDEEDKAILASESRPAVSFNRIEASIDAITGVDIASEREILPIPRDTGAKEINEALAGVIKFLREESETPSEESDVLADTLTCGVGAMSIEIDDISEADPTIRAHHVDILDTLWDSSAKRRNLLDARWVSMTKQMSSETIMAMWPHLDESMIHQIDSTNPVPEQRSIFDEWMFNPILDYPENDYTDLEDTLHGKQTTAGTMPVTEYQWFEFHTLYQVQTEDGIVELSQQQFTESGIDEKSVMEGLVRKTSKKIYYQAFLVGDKIAQRGIHFCQIGFTILFCTGKRSRATNQWYGPTKNMIDPQKWANRFFSLIIDIIGRNTKGGAFAEFDAFLDARKAETDWAKSAPLIMMKRGGINKVRERQASNYPVGVERMMEFAMESVRDISGINLEILGLANRRQAGVVETERKRSVMGIFSCYFDSLRMMRVLEGKILIHLIPKYIPPDKLIAIDSENGMRFAAMAELYDPDGPVRYDVIVDEAPNSPTSKDRAWYAIQQVLPILLKQGVPIPPEIIDYMPIPKALADVWKRELTPIYQQYLAATQAGIPMGGMAGDDGQPVNTTSPQNENDQINYLENL